MRNALVIKWDGLLLHGTSHIGSGPVSRGILFFNSGSQPRSSRGDLNVHLADELCEQGFACFRFDLPGLGDSQGRLPGQYLELYQFIQEGGYAACAAALAQILLKDFGLSEMMLAGTCGGALTAVFTANKVGPEAVRGLVLLDLPFFLYEGTQVVGAERRAKNSWYQKALKQTKSWHAAIHDWVLERSWEPVVTAAYRQLKTLAIAALPKRLPANTNLKLLGTLSGLLEQGVSVLLVTAHPLPPQPAGFDYISPLQSRHPQRLKHAKIYGTTHSFVENGGRQAVVTEVTKWISNSTSVNPALKDPCAVPVESLSRRNTTVAANAG